MASIAEANRGLQAVRDENKTKLDDATTEYKSAQGTMDDIANQVIPDVPAQASIDPKAMMFASLAANIANAINPNAHAIDQLNTQIAYRNNELDKAHQELIRKHDDMKSERLFKYQNAAEKYRRASELYDKYGDQDRALEMAQKHDLVLKRMDAIIQDRNKQADLSIQREQLGITKQAALQAQHDRTYLGLINNLEQNAKAQEESAKTATGATQDYFTMAARRNRLMLQHINEQGLLAGGDPTKIKLDMEYPYKAALSAFQNAVTAQPSHNWWDLNQDNSPRQPLSPKTFDVEFKRTRGFSNDREFANQWGISRNDFRNWYRRNYGN